MSGSFDRFFRQNREGALLIGYGAVLIECRALFDNDCVRCGELGRLEIQSVRFLIDYGAVLIECRLHLIMITYIVENSAVWKFNRVFELIDLLIVCSYEVVCE